MIRNIRYRRDQRQLEEEEEIWFNEEDDFTDVPTAKPEIESYSMMKSNRAWKLSMNVSKFFFLSFFFVRVWADKIAEKNGQSKTNSTSPTSTNSHSSANALPAGNSQSSSSPPLHQSSPHSSASTTAAAGQQSSVTGAAIGLNNVNNNAKDDPESDETETLTTEITPEPTPKQVTTGSLKKVSLIQCNNVLNLKQKEYLYCAILRRINNAIITLSYRLKFIVIFVISLRPFNMGTIHKMDEYVSHPFSKISYHECTIW